MEREEVSAARLQRMSAPTRELAQGLSGTAEVLLLWHPEGDRVVLFVSDPATDGGFHFEVESGNAIDAFYHPYAHATRRGAEHHPTRETGKPSPAGLRRRELTGGSSRAGNGSSRTP